MFFFFQKHLISIRNQHNFSNKAKCSTLKKVHFNQQSEQKSNEEREMMKVIDVEQVYLGYTEHWPNGISQTN